VRTLLTFFNLLLEIVFWVCYPVLFFILKKKNYLAAIHPEGENTQHGILFHAASLGEVAAIKTLVQYLLKALPDTRIAITTSTLTGLKLAAGISPKVTTPLSVLDLPHLRHRQLKLINPKLICIVETEIWLNLLKQAKDMEMKVLFINARMSANSLSRYCRIDKLLHSLETPIEKILAQSNEDAERFSRLFHKPVQMAGNLKYCLELPEYNSEVERKQWGYTQQDLILCCGSTRPGEEELLLKVWSELSNSLPELKLILAIRHPKRMSEIKEMLSVYPYKLFSQLEQAKQKPILVIDTLGVLDKAYAICDVALVGGSFFNFGGHNPLEPAFYAKPIIMGPYYNSCKDSVQQLHSTGGILLSNQETLKNDLQTIMSDPSLRQQMGANAKKVLTEYSSSLIVQKQAIMELMNQ